MNACYGKKRYRTPTAARAAMWKVRDNALQVYYCPICSGYHYGSYRYDPRMKDVVKVPTGAGNGQR